MSFISDNGGPIVIGGVVLAVLTGYIELRMPAAVKAQLEESGIVPRTTITAIQEDITDLEHDAERLDDKIERIIGILLEE